MLHSRVKKTFHLRRKGTTPFFKKKWFWKTVLFAVLFSVLFPGIFYFSFGKIFSLKTVKVQGNQTISSENIEALVFEKAKDILPLLHSKSIIFVDKNFLANIIKQNFPRTADVRIKRRWPNTLEVVIKERGAVAVLCRKETCYLIDQKGVAFKEVLAPDPKQTDFIFEAPESDKEGVLLPQFEDLSLQDQITLGQRAMDPTDVKKLLAITLGLATVPDFKVAKIVKVDAKRANALLQEGWQIFFNLEDQISYQINNLKLLLEKKISQEDRHKLEYIDLRFGSRIYYKFK